VFATLLTTPTLMLVALAGGFTMFVQGTFLAWLPSYLNRYYGLDPAKASAGTGLLIVCAGVGMIVGGALVDRLSRHDRDRRLRICVIYCAILAGSLLLAFSFEPGIVQFLLIGLGLSMSSSFLGPALAVAADVTPESSHATTFAVLALAYMLIGAAPGPLVTGWIADVTSLKTALFLAPIGGVAGACFFFLASRTYRRDRQQLHGR
jgi:MFS family permease